MSIEFEEFEEPLSRIGSLVVTVSALVLTIFGAMGLPILNNVETFGTNSLSIGYAFLFVMILAGLIFLLALLSFIRPWLNFKINVFVAAVISLVLSIVLILAVPGEPVQEDITLAMQTFIWIGIAGISMIFVSKRPNLGKESNKHIYQAYGAVIEFIVAFTIFLLGIYVIFFDISQYAGNGTFPGGFETTYVKDQAAIETTYGLIRTSGVIMIVGSIIIMAASVIRNIISLKIAAGVIIAGIIVVLVGISSFFNNWVTLDGLFEKNFEDEYQTQLALTDPVVVDLGIVLVLLLFIGLTMIIYASTQSEPIEKWRAKRNHALAAAEVAVRDQKLSKAVKYLEQASIFSSKLGEEDKSVELITRINNIKEKAIKMRKSEAAEKKKQELEKAKKKAAAKAPKGPKEE